jgi:hypothetical protein
MLPADTSALTQPQCVGPRRILSFARRPDWSRGVGGLMPHCSLCNRELKDEETTWRNPLALSAAHWTILA